jgi:DNA-binding CsgD family transcriptional regulator
MRVRPASEDVVNLGARRRGRLEALVRRSSAPQRLVLRARIVLSAAQGHTNAQIARELAPFSAL